jgi:Ca2+-binding RTX toxin-like protein
MLFEKLESRQLLASTVSLVAGTLTITGTSGNDDIYMNYSPGNNFRITDHNVQIGLVAVSSVKKVVVNTNAGDDYAYITHFDKNVPVSLNGGDGADGLTAAVYGAATLIGGAGNDVLVGGSGNDSLDGGDGNDVVSGANGNDTVLGGAGVDLIGGGGGNDLLDGGLGADRIRGNEGADTVTYASRTKAVFVDLTDASTELADDGELGEKDFVEADVENIIGGSGNDKLTGSTYAASPIGYTKNNKLVGGAGNDTLVGLDGNDILDGGDGNDSLDGGAGNDNLIAGIGTDKLIGGAGTDAADYSGRSDALILTLDGKANDGKVGENDLISADIENVNGGKGNDKIVGDKNNNVLKGNDGNDTINAGAGNDSLDGGKGIDLLYGEDGNDVITAKDGVKDSLFGGNGTDKAQRDNAGAIVDAVNAIETYF